MRARLLACAHTRTTFLDVVSNTEHPILRKIIHGTPLDDFPYAHYLDNKKVVGAEKGKALEISRPALSEDVTFDIGALFFAE